MTVAAVVRQQATHLAALDVPVHTLWLNAFHADAAGQGPDELAAAHGEEAVRNLRVLLRLLLVQNARCLSGR